MTSKLVTTAYLLHAQQYYLLCRWERHLAGFPHLVVVDRWPAAPKRARRSALICFLVIGG